MESDYSNDLQGSGLHPLCEEEIRIQHLLHQLISDCHEEGPVRSGIWQGNEKEPRSLKDGGSGSRVWLNRAHPLACSFPAPAYLTCSDTGKPQLSLTASCDLSEVMCAS